MSGGELAVLGSAAYEARVTPLKTGGRRDVEVIPNDPTAPNRRYTVIRRNRANSATLTVHGPGCPTVKRAEIATFIHAPNDIAASIQASQMFASEIHVGRSKWGAECTRCGE